MLRSFRSAAEAKFNRLAHWPPPPAPLSHGAMAVKNAAAALHMARMSESACVILFSHFISFFAASYFENKGDKFISEMEVLITD